MCNFFSCIVTKAGKVRFTESESHETVVSRSELKDDLGHFVRVEYTAREGYMIDQASIPEWYERIAAMTEANVIATYKRVAPAWYKYKRMHRLIWDEYKQVQKPAADAYDRVARSARDEHKQVQQSAWGVYKQMHHSASVKYKQMHHSALDKYKTAIVNVPGYLKA